MPPNSYREEGEKLIFLIPPPLPIAIGTLVGGQNGAHALWSKNKPLFFSEVIRLF